MMRRPVFACLFLGLALSLCGCGASKQAGAPAEVSIEKVRLGFPAGGDDSRFKAGHWAPVYVELIAGPAGIKAGQYALVVGTSDVDNVGNQYTVPLPAADPKETFTVTTYVKPGSSYAEAAVSVYELVKGEQDQAGHLGRKIAGYGSDKRYMAQRVDGTLYLTVGSRLPEFQKAVAKGPNNQTTTNEQVASLDTVPEMPTQWYGYDAVDVLILCTSNRRFMEQLVGDEKRWNAVAEWVRRGGRIVISAGRNQHLVSALDQQQPLLPMTVSEDKIKLARPAGEAPGGGHHLLVWHDQRGQFRLVERLDRNDKRQPIELAKLRPKDATDKGLQPDRYRASVWVVPPAPKDGPPLFVRGAYGLGQVMLVALDLDQMPFSDKGGDNSEKDFWQMFRVELGGEQKAAPNPQAGFGGFYPGYNMDMATRLQQSLEDFEDIPVIGFGWVALFILLYIVVVGPLDYLFLKKVLKRLELTWVTFPVVVVLISVLAYFTAYWIKGDKLKINKVDLVDIDLQTEQAYGNTWFTLFSPRIDHYTIGVEPVAPEWAPAPASDPMLLVSWMDRPEENPYGSGRTRSQSLFRRTYDYEPNATALRGVPIQVWSTKTFTARWQVPARKQMFTHTLKPAVQSDRISGTITSHLPVELTEVVFFYRGRLYEVGRLLPNVETRLDDLQRNARGLDTWYQSLNAGPMEFGYGRRRQQHREPTEPLMKWILFYRDAASIRSQENAARDSSLRYLDQSWQLRNLRDEVIIYGRVPVLNGEAQKISEDPGSPSRLWLHQLPKPGEKWPGLSGTLRQETFVRVFIPLQSQPPVAEGRD